MTNQNHSKKKSRSNAHTAEPRKKVPSPITLGSGLVVVIACIAAWNLWPNKNDSIGDTQAKPAATRNQFDNPSSMPVVSNSVAPLVAEENKRRAQAQFEQVAKTYCSYLESTKYPNNSRPISQHPDQIYPNQAVKESHPMRNQYGGADRSIMLQTSQSRIYLAANETVQLSLKAVDQNGNPQNLRIESASARGLVFDSKASPPILNINFSANSGEPGSLSTSVAPAASSFARFDGTIRVDISYQVNDKRGQVFFDFIYSPETPAVWSGKIRETTENGDLKFFLPVTIKTPGRYLASARLDDAKGKPVAYLSFNDLLKQSDTEIPLTVAGKLIRDLEVQFPVTLRDIDAYLLKENVDPDRQLMPRLEGAQYLSKVYPLKGFSNDEWQSEERSRYLTEFGKDVQLARSALIATDPSLGQSPKVIDPCLTK
ncbi:hypothetical protein RF679_14640 [Undibacterium cyanobacteriorum]|uniref:Uncharacterized protein n=1 Tax=Undibacterium cyanobacteriorum TaxID=3073561 RepID=A0ABY9RF94_9BURK|nr:hypothetical protein [Undibacterium sp. 20NA77.5]WMW79874.1 hypothetical protein RF679_14640 [Undibacterium sp. 20NA77.5]